MDKLTHVNVGNDMGAGSGRWRRVWIGCAIASVCWAVAAAGLPDTTGFRPVLPVLSTTAESASGMAPAMHHMALRVEHTIDRFVGLIGEVGAFWLSMVMSLAVFLIIAAFSSVADTRMLALRRQRPGAVGRYLGYGMRTFFLILIDRHTPNTARLLMAVGMLYWLLPFDLISDSTVVPGFVDDFLITVAVAKAFVYLCPAALVAEHAHAVEARAHRRQELGPSKPFAGRR